MGFETASNVLVRFESLICREAFIGIVSEDCLEYYFIRECDLQPNKIPRFSHSRTAFRFCGETFLTWSVSHRDDTEDV